MGSLSVGDGPGHGTRGRYPVFSRLCLQPSPCLAKRRGRAGHPGCALAHNRSPVTDLPSRAWSRKRLKTNENHFYLIDVKVSARRVGG